ncbi:MAG TPA: hypothetical protein VIU64_02445 [Polyangia bacterium]
MATRDGSIFLGRPALSILALVAAAPLLTLGGCLGARFDKPDPAPAANASTTQLLDLIAREREARKLSPAMLVPELRPIALRETVGVARGDRSLATAAHAAGLAAVQTMGRHIWTFATDCGDLAQLRLPPLATEMRELVMNAAAVAGHDGRTYLLIVIAEPGASALRAESMGGGTLGANRSPEAYVHPVVAAGRCGDRWPAASPSGT